MTLLHNNPTIQASTTPFRDAMFVLNHQKIGVFSNELVVNRGP